MTTEQLVEKALADDWPITSLRELGQPGRGHVYVSDSLCVGLIQRSSRVLRRDAERFFSAVSAASQLRGQRLAGHLVICGAPVCSQARAWLEEREVSLELRPRSPA